MREPAVDGTASQDHTALDRVLGALANAHRREIVRMVGLHPCAISHLARERDLSLPAIGKHIGVLEAAGLVHRRKRGRTTYLTIGREPLRELQTWIADFHLYWGSDQATYENLDRYLDANRDGERAPTTPHRQAKEPPPS